MKDVIFLKLYRKNRYEPSSISLSDSYPHLIAQFDLIVNTSCQIKRNHVFCASRYQNKFYKKTSDKLVALHSRHSLNGEPSDTTYTKLFIGSGKDDDRHGARQVVQVVYHLIAAAADIAQLLKIGVGQLDRPSLQLRVHKHHRVVRGKQPKEITCTGGEGGDICLAVLAVRRS